MKVNEKFDKKLLVEGNDDQHVILALCQKFNIAHTFDVIDCEGIDKLSNQIPIRFKQSEIQTLGFIIDADSDLLNRWHSLRSILILQGLSVPAILPSTGLIINMPGKIKIGVWIMPNNNLNGMLEDFVSFLIPDGDDLIPIVHSVLDDIEHRHLCRYSPIHKSKALIHSWLSLQEEPGSPMGLGITKRYLTTDVDTCARLIGWIDELFNT
jgi:hypothetical protein